MNEAIPPVVRIPVGVVVERRKAMSQWADFIWQPVAVLPGVPDAKPWSVLKTTDDVTSFYAGEMEMELHRAHSPFYRDNLASGAPLLWIVLYPAEGDPPYTLATVTADPSEGEAFTETGTNLVESVAMPEAIREIVAAFAAGHPTEQLVFKRKRERANPEALARRAPVRGERQ